MRLRPAKWRFYAHNPLGSVSIRDYIDLKWHEEVARCIRFITSGSIAGVYMGGQWEHSNGCKYEQEAAIATGIPVFYDIRSLMAHDFTTYLEYQTVAKAAADTVKEVMDTARNSSKHGPYSWLKEGAKHHLKKAIGHLGRYLWEGGEEYEDIFDVIQLKEEDPLEDSLKNTLCRVAMALECRDGGDDDQAKE